METTKKYFTYALYSNVHDQLYIGNSDNLERRFKEHNSGRVSSTKPYRPYIVLYTEEFDTKKDAVFREKELKKTSGRKFLRGLL